MSRSDAPTDPPPEGDAPEDEGAEEEDDAPKDEAPSWGPEPMAERYAVACAWRTVAESKDDDPIADCPLVATMFTALATPYKAGKDDPPICGILDAIRATVAGWKHARGGGLFASVARVDLSLMMRRIDVALALARSDARYRQGGAP